MVKKISLFSLTAILSFIIGYSIASFIITNKYETFIQSISTKRADNTAYPFVHPILGVTSDNAASVGEFQPLAQKVRNIFSANASILSRYSIYFKDENNGLWFGINENDTYNPASMLKVVLAIATYKEAEANPHFLYGERIYTPELAQLNVTLPYSLPSELRVNQSYTIGDLVEKMLVDSDNGAKDILANTLDQNIIGNVYANVGVNPPINDEQYTISAKQYSSFFKILYNGNYLNLADSNQLISILSETTFDKGIVAGVPTGTIVADKYGEYVNDSNNTPTSMELHDCGIVYLEKSPYVLCIMTEGTNEADLSSVIAKVSQVVYNEVKNNYK